jgi:class 3 adenylate cyclase
VSDRLMIFRVDVNFGEMIVQAGGCGGNTVSIAARLESTAKPRGIVISDAV